MAIETGAIFKKLYFDGQSSGDYGVYISGAGTFNAPVRDIEMVSIPGRNGALALDKGRFENIEVTYKAGLFGVDEADFADAISDFRNFLCSRNGYARLEDDYNPNEYRMAVYKNGLNVDLATLEAGEFEITFDCKPQRWLKSGETTVTVESGDTLTNPTLFECSPLLEVEGYGKVAVNGEEIEIISTSIGLIELGKGVVIDKDLSSTNANPYYQKTYTLEGVDNLRNGDEIYIQKEDLTGSARFYNYNNYVNSRSFVVNSATGLTYTSGTTSGGWIQNIRFTNNPSFIKGTASTVSGSLSVTKSIYVSGSVASDITDNLTLLFSVAYDGNNTIVMRISYGTVSQWPAGSEYPNTDYYYPMTSMSFTSPNVYGMSTKSALGEPLYIDLEIGEAWKIESGAVVSVNNALIIPADLPVLVPGANTFAYDSTVANLGIVPRWWKV